MFKRLAPGLLILLLALAAAVAINTLRNGSQQLQASPLKPVAVDQAAAAQRLSMAVRFRTISSFEDARQNAAEFVRLHAFLEQSFPRLHAALKRELIGNNNALLYTWTGSDPAAAPIALMAHQDVVPIASGTEAQWQADPFGGAIRDGFVWGRGAWDNKGNLMSQMEAVEMLLASGFKPRRTVYLVLGDDEEVGGQRGAKLIAETLKSRGVRLDYVLDEGLLVTEGIVAGLDKPAALIGLAEKGYGTFYLSLDTAPGHSSMPPLKSAIGSMSAALARLEAHQMPASMTGIAEQLFGTLAPEMGGLNRVLLSNLWLFRPLVQAQLEKSPATQAMLRTTTALTIINAGNKDNVLPGHAQATVNFRLLPGDTLAGVQQHLKEALADDAIQIKAYPANAEPSPVSASSGPAWDSLNRTVREVFPDAVVAPGLMVAATDSHHFSIVSDSIYRFSPVRARGEDLPRFHGTNERMSIAHYAEMIQFYHQLLRNSAGPAAAVPAPA